MVKKLSLLILLLCVMAGQVVAIDLGKKLALRMVAFPLNPPLDTGLLNTQKWPDSASIASWATSGADTGNTTSQVIFGTSTTTVTATGLAALGIRADSVGTNTPFFVFTDTLRILNAGTTTRQIVGVVSLWRLGMPFMTPFSVYVCGDTLIDSMRAVGTTSTATTLTNTVTLAAGQFTKIKDTTIAAFPTVTLAPGQFTKIKDTTIAAMPTVTLAPGQFTKIKDTTIAAFPTVTLTPGQFTKIKDTTVAAIPVEWTAAQRDSAIARILYTRDSLAKYKDSLDAKISSRSTYSGGAVQSVTNPVTVGTNNDKELSAARLAKIDSITNLFLTFDTMMVASGYAVGSRSTMTYTVNADTMHVYKGGVEYMILIRKHPGRYPGARPDSTARTP